MKAIIVDDSNRSRSLLRLMLHELARDIAVVAEAINADEALEKIQVLRPDIVFLDIEMPGKSGLQLAEHLKKIDFNGKIIFITAYNEHALRAFRLSAVDYLLKPLQESHLSEAIRKIRAFNPTFNREQLSVLKYNFENMANAKIAIPVVGGADYLPLSQIVCFEADGAYVKIHLQTGETKVYSKNLKYFENTLSEHTEFIRTHRSYIINRLHINTLQRGDQAMLILTNKITVPVSREKRQLVYSLI